MMFNYPARRDRLDWEATSRGLALELGVGNVGPISHHALDALTGLIIIHAAFRSTDGAVSACIGQKHTNPRSSYRRTETR
jgi:hypothetical protein